MHWIRAVVVWLIVLSVETIHGVLREVLLAPSETFVHAK
jgi:hypothetical protein